MKINILRIANLFSGIYSKPEINADVYYLQSTDFTNSQTFNSFKPQLKLEKINDKHLLQDGDVLLAAKGIKNFAVKYTASMGKAVASSSFIVIRIKEENKKIIMPEYLAWYLNNIKKLHLLQQQQLGTTIPSISIKQIENLEINIPELHIQNHIVRIQQIKDKRNKLTKELEKQKDILFQKQLIKAVNGK